MKKPLHQRTIQKDKLLFLSPSLLVIHSPPSHSTHFSLPFSLIPAFIMLFVSKDLPSAKALLCFYEIWHIVPLSKSWLYIGTGWRQYLLLITGQIRIFFAMTLPITGPQNVCFRLKTNSSCAWRQRVGLTGDRCGDLGPTHVCVCIVWACVCETQDEYELWIWLFSTRLSCNTLSEWIENYWFMDICFCLWLESLWYKAKQKTRFK